MSKEIIREKTGVIERKPPEKDFKFFVPENDSDVKKIFLPHEENYFLVVYIKQRGCPFWISITLPQYGSCAQYDIENTSTWSLGGQRIFLRKTSYLSSTLIIGMKFRTQIGKNPYSPENMRILRRIRKKDISINCPDSL